MTDMTARDQIITIIERQALIQERLFCKVAPEVITDPANQELIASALGNYWRAKPPSMITINKWKDPEKLKLAKQFPNLTPEELALAAPYLHPRNRPRYNPIQAECKPYFERGFTHNDVSQMVEVPLSTLYRWFPINEKPWVNRAQALLAEGNISKRKVAAIVGVSYRQLLRRFPK